MPKLFTVAAGSDDAVNLTVDSVGEVPVTEGGADVLLRLWKMVPMVVDWLIKGWLFDGAISERVDTFELPRARVWNSGLWGTESCPLTAFRGVVAESGVGEGKGGSGWESLLGF